MVWCACTSNSTMVRVQGWEVREICKIWGGPTWPYNRINLHRSLWSSQTVCRRRWATLMSLWLHGWKGRYTAIKQHTLVLFKAGDRPVIERTDGWTTQPLWHAIPQLHRRWSHALAQGCRIERLQFLEVNRYAIYYTPGVHVRRGTSNIRDFSRET